MFGSVVGLRLERVSGGRIAWNGWNGWIIRSTRVEADQKCGECSESVNRGSDRMASMVNALSQRQKSLRSYGRTCFQSRIYFHVIKKSLKDGRNRYGFECLRLTEKKNYESRH